MVFNWAVAAPHGFRVKYASRPRRRTPTPIDERRSRSPRRPARAPVPRWRRWERCRTGFPPFRRFRSHCCRGPLCVRHPGEPPGGAHARDPGRPAGRFHDRAAENERTVAHALARVSIRAEARMIPRSDLDYGGARARLRGRASRSGIPVRPGAISSSSRSRPQTVRVVAGLRAGRFGHAGRARAGSREARRRRRGRNRYSLHSRITGPKACPHPGSSVAPLGDAGALRTSPDGGRGTLVTRVDQRRAATPDGPC